MPRFVSIVLVAFFSLLLVPVTSYSAELSQEKEYRQEAILELQQLREDSQNHEEKIHTRIKEIEHRLIRLFNTVFVGFIVLFILNISLIVYVVMLSKQGGDGLTRLVQKISKKIIPLSLLVIVIISFFYYKNYQTSQKHEAQQIAQKLANDALMAYKIGAERGVAEAQYNLGGSYYGGVGTPQDLNKAFFWFQKAADQGHIYSQKNLAQLYSGGIGVKQSDSEAFKWYLKAAEQGDAASQLQVGKMYAQGQGVAQDNKAAFYWLSIAHESGETSASAARDEVARQLTAKESGDAKNLIQKWHKKKP